MKRVLNNGNNGSFRTTQPETLVNKQVIENNYELHDIYLIEIMYKRIYKNIELYHIVFKK